MTELKDQAKEQGQDAMRKARKTMEAYEKLRQEHVGEGHRDPGSLEEQSQTGRAQASGAFLIQETMLAGSQKGSQVRFDTRVTLGSLTDWGCPMSIWESYRSAQQHLGWLAHAVRRAKMRARW